MAVADEDEEAQLAPADAGRADARVVLDDIEAALDDVAATLAGMG